MAHPPHCGRVVTIPARHWAVWEEVQAVAGERGLVVVVVYTIYCKCCRCYLGKWGGVMVPRVIVVVVTGRERHMVRRHFYLASRWSLCS
jgi:hypothetical protein